MCSSDLNQMIKYKIIDNFLNSNECQNLIDDAENILNKIGSRQILNNNREITQSTSIKFRKLLSYSENWRQFNNKISSQDFFDKCMENLGINDLKFYITNFFDPKEISVEYLKYKEFQQKIYQLLLLMNLPISLQDRRKRSLDEYPKSRVL